MMGLAESRTDRAVRQPCLAFGGRLTGHLRVSAGAAVILAGILGAPDCASAQTFSTVIVPSVAPDYFRDRNVSVLEQPHPDYDALGVETGGVVVYPSVAAGVGAINNTYNNDSNKQASLFAAVQAGALARTEWTRHQITLQVSDDSRRYFGQSARNQDNWYVDLAGELDISDTLTAKANVQTGRFFESPFSSDASSKDEVLSNYLRQYGAVNLVWAQGRVRLTAGYDRTSLNFNTLHFDDGTTTDQTYRNRNYSREYLRSEYALSPSVSLYGQASFDQVSYELATFAGLPNRNSNGQQVIGGLSFDMAGLLRGNVGLGYSHRSFQAATYSDISGFSAQARVDFFLTELTTLTLLGQRTLQDSSLGTASGFWDSRVQLELDHSLRDNIVISPQIQYVTQSFVGLNGGRTFFAAGLSGQLQFNRRLGLSANVGYSHAATQSSGGGTPFTEISGLLTIKYRL